MAACMHAEGRQGGGGYNALIITELKVNDNVIPDVDTPPDTPNNMYS